MKMIVRDVKTLVGVLQLKKCPIVIANGAFAERLVEKRNEAIAKSLRLLLYTSFRERSAHANANAMTGFGSFIFWNILETPIYRVSTSGFILRFSNAK
jgi:hypothetical protein